MALTHLPAMRNAAFLRIAIVSQSPSARSEPRPRVTSPDPTAQDAGIEAVLLSQETQVKALAGKRLAEVAQSDGRRGGLEPSSC